jgi:hypothetical protein
VRVPVTFAPLTGSTARITVTRVRAVSTTEYHEIVPIVMPVALAEVGIPGVQRSAPPSQLPSTCRTDLLTVDGNAVGVRVAGSTQTALSLAPVDFQLCDPINPAAPAPTISLAPGTHVVRSVPGTSTGIGVDGVVLGSQAGGAAMALGPGGTVPTAATAAAKSSKPTAATPKVQVVHNGRTKVSLKVTGATPGSPFWLVLGESNNAGWEATVNGKDVGGSTLVNGYANGWFVNPTSSTFDVTLKWKPQQNVWIALAVSAAALVLCLVLALRRRRGVAAVVSAPPASDAEPVFASPFVAAGTAPSLRGLVLGPVLAGVAGAVLARWWVGAVAAVCVLAVLLRPRLRPLLTIGAPLAVVLTGVYVIVQQYRYHYFSSFEWPTHFERVNDLAWLAVILLLADALVEILRRPPVHRRDRGLPIDEASSTEKEPVLD